MKTLQRDLITQYIYFTILTFANIHVRPSVGKMTDKEAVCGFNMSCCCVYRLTYLNCMQCIVVM